MMYAVGKGVSCVEFQAIACPAASEAAITASQSQHQAPSRVYGSGRLSRSVTFDVRVSPGLGRLFDRPLDARVARRSSALGALAPPAEQKEFSPTPLLRYIPDCCHFPKSIERQQIKTGFAQQFFVPGSQLQLNALVTHYPKILQCASLIHWNAQQILGMRFYPIEHRMKLIQGFSLLSKLLTLLLSARWHSQTYRIGRRPTPLH
jgi:hypothetical protein